MLLKTLSMVITIVAVFCMSSSASVLVSPVQIDQMDSTNRVTINELFLESYQSSAVGQAVIVDETVLCRDKVCAVEAGKKAGAEEVVYGLARKLGEKWIVSGYRIKVSDGSIIASNRLNSKSIEDFEFVMKRLADGLATGKKVDETATIDNVTESEMDEGQYRRREGFYAIGFKTGFLFPVPGHEFYSRYETNYNYLNSSYDPTLKTYSQIINTDMVNWFELPRDLALEWDLHVGWMNEIGSHFSLLKIFSRSDFAPFAGGGIGIDYVFPDENGLFPDKRNAGFAVNGKAGMIFLRTYSFRVFTDVGYKVVFNSDFDQAVCVDMGILWKKAPAATGPSFSRPAGNPLVGGLAIVGGVLVGLIVLGMVSSMAMY